MAVGYPDLRQLFRMLSVLREILRNRSVSEYIAFERRLVAAILGAIDDDDRAWARKALGLRAEPPAD